MALERVMGLTREQMQQLGMSEEQIEAAMNANDARQQKKRFFRPVLEAKSEVPVNCNDVMSVTTVEDLQAYSKGTLVRFPDFAEGQPFVARVKRPSMLVLAKQGKIPNTLLASANELFSKGGAGMDTDNEAMLADIYSIMEIICESALKEPTYQQIRDAGVELSDEQLMAVFNYTQTGVKALESFR